MVIFWKFLFFCTIFIIICLPSDGIAKDANAVIAPAIKGRSNGNNLPDENAKVVQGQKGKNAKIVAENGDDSVDEQLSEEMSMKDLLLLLTKEHCKLMKNFEHSLNGTHFDAEFGGKITKNCMALLEGKQLDNGSQMFDEGKVPNLLQEHGQKMVDQLKQIESEAIVCRNGEKGVKLSEIMAQTTGRRPTECQLLRQKVQPIVDEYNSWQNDLAVHVMTPAESKNAIQKFLAEQRQKASVTVVPMPSDMMKLAMELFQMYKNGAIRNSNADDSNAAVGDDGERAQPQQQKLDRNSRSAGGRRRRKRAHQNITKFSFFVGVLLFCTAFQFLTLLYDVCEGTKEALEENFLWWMVVSGPVVYAAYYYCTEFDPTFARKLYGESKDLVVDLIRWFRQWLRHNRHHHN